MKSKYKQISSLVWSWHPAMIYSRVIFLDFILYAYPFAFIRQSIFGFPSPAVISAPFLVLFPVW